MKKILCLFILLVTSITMVSCTKSGNSKNVVVNVNATDTFDEKELNNAVIAVEEKFKEFQGCELKNIWYNEEYSNLHLSSYLKEGYTKGNIIVLLSDFKVDSSGGDGSLTPNSTYINWNWILVREDKYSDWQVIDWGY